MVRPFVRSSIRPLPTISCLSMIFKINSSFIISSHFLLGGGGKGKMRFIHCEWGFFRLPSTPPFFGRLLFVLYVCMYKYSTDIHVVDILSSHLNGRDVIPFVLFLLFFFLF